MMVFFEFFFSGPGWGWRLVGLIFLISIVIEFVPRVMKTVYDYKLERFKIELNEAAKILDKSEDEGTPATIDDVRS